MEVAARKVGGLLGAFFCPADVVLKYLILIAFQSYNQKLQEIT
jgi:hypothetical protein